MMSWMAWVHQWGMRQHGEQLLVVGWCLHTTLHIVLWTGISVFHHIGNFDVDVLPMSRNWCCWWWGECGQCSVMTSQCIVDLHGCCQMGCALCMGFCTQRGYIPYLWFAGSLNLEFKLTGMPISFPQCMQWHCGVWWLGRHTISIQSHHGWQWNLKNLYVGTCRFVLKEYVAGNFCYYLELWHTTDIRLIVVCLVPV